MLRLPSFFLEILLSETSEPAEIEAERVATHAVAVDGYAASVFAAHAL